jgi:integrase
MKKAVKKIQIAVERMVEQRKQQHQYWSILRGFTGFLGKECPFEAILNATEEDAFSYKHFLETEFATATAAVRMKILKSIFNGLWRAGYVKADPFAIVKAPTQRGSRVRWYRALDIEEVKKVTHEVDAREEPEAARDAVIFRLLFVHALRISEALNLQYADYDGQIVVVRGTKERGDFELELDEETNRALVRFLEWRGKNPGYLLPSIVNGSKAINTTVDVKTINARLRKYAERAKVNQFTSHSGRVTAITQALTLGYTKEQVMRFSRHHSIEIIDRYDRRRLDKVKLRYGGANYGQKQENGAGLDGNDGNSTSCREGRKDRGDCQG